MKMALSLLLLLAAFNVIAFEIKVSKMSRTAGYEQRWDLKTTLDEKVVLDCQSFLQGLIFGPMGENVIMLQEWECEELARDMKRSQSKRKSHCLEVDFDRSVIDRHETCRN